MRVFMEVLSAMLALAAGFGALAAFATLPAAVAARAREPEDVATLLLSATTCAILCICWGRVAFRLGATPPPARPHRDHATTLLLAVTGLLLALVGATDPLDGVRLVPLGVLCIGSAALFSAREPGQRRRPS